MRRECFGFRRRGAAATLVIVSMPIVIIFSALTIDVGNLYRARRELQQAADSAALAGVSAYLTDAGLKEDHTTVSSLTSNRAQRLSKENATLNKGTLLAGSDIALGTHDYANPKGALTQSGHWNAAEVITRRTSSGLNGSVPFFFAGFFGIHEGQVTARARAAADDHFAGYNLERETHALIPFTIDTTLYDQMAASGSDSYSYDGSVHSTSDQIHEIRLFPWKLNNVTGVDGAAGSGNFGTLNVGVGNQGTSTLSTQITDGIAASDLVKEFGTSDLRFYDSNGSAKTYSGTGNPGMSTGIKDNVNARLGQVVGFFVHKSFSDNGSNTTYQISGIRFGRIMYVDLTGSPKTRTITIQPVAYTDASIETDPAAPSTNGKIVRILLVQ